LKTKLKMKIIAFWLQWQEIIQNLIFILLNFISIKLNKEKIVYLLYVVWEKRVKGTWALYYKKYKFIIQL
jgi:hypothetical protein